MAHFWKPYVSLMIPTSIRDDYEVSQLYTYRLETYLLKLVKMLHVLYLLMRLMLWVEKEDQEILVVMTNEKIHSINYLLKWMVCVYLVAKHTLHSITLLALHQDLIQILMSQSWLVQTDLMFWTQHYLDQEDLIDKYICLHQISRAGTYFNYLSFSNSCTLDSRCCKPSSTFKQSNQLYTSQHILFRITYVCRCT